MKKEAATKKIILNILISLLLIITVFTLSKCDLENRINPVVNINNFSEIDNEDECTVSIADCNQSQCSSFVSNCNCYHYCLGIDGVNPNDLEGIPGNVSVSGIDDSNTVINCFYDVTCCKEYGLGAILPTGIYDVSMYFCDDTRIWRGIRRNLRFNSTGVYPSNKITLQVYFYKN